MNGRESRPLDAIDRMTLRTLQEEGRTSWAKLAEIVGLSPPSATERVRRLEESGHIRGIHATLGAEELGYGTLGFVAVAVRDTAEHVTLLEHVRRLPEVQECHVVAGEYDYLLKVRARGPKELAALLRNEVRSLPGVSRTNTLFVMETIKETRDLPVADDPSDDARPGSASTD